MAGDEQLLPKQKAKQGASNGSPLRRVASSTEITEENLEHQRRWQHHLSVEIPARNMEEVSDDFVAIQMPSYRSPTSTPKRVNFSPFRSPSFAIYSESPDGSTSKAKSTRKNLLPKLSFKYRRSTADIERAAILALGGSPDSVKERSFFRRTTSLTKLFGFTPRANNKNTTSLPVSPISRSNPESIHGRHTIDPHNSAKGEAQLPMHRSRSVPVLNKEVSLRQLDSLGGVIRVIPATPRSPIGTLQATSMPSPGPETDENDDGGEDIPVEEAVCRICLVELGEAGDTLKMECCCKGELALAHQECLVKWFNIKGNKICDVCKEEVKNLPVTLLRIHTSQSRRNGAHVELAPYRQRTNVSKMMSYRVWQDVPILVIVSMLAYFCFLEQLLVAKLGSGAIAISLPFACILGLLASMSSTTMVRRKYVWAYATAQFVLVVIAGHLFYSLVGDVLLILIHMQAVLSVLLATFTGFGATMCMSSGLTEILKWRGQLRARSGQPRTTRNSTQPATELPSQQHGSGNQTPAAEAPYATAMAAGLSPSHFPTIASPSQQEVVRGSEVTPSG
ncbi:unnamed protein product [Linum tenue]|uniref:RING-CH-type domain-containing protein n=1 Tax=Linum tenue TaxID=586396 RepID=A0AAV0KNS5_9ROSI|nr:unnamed protein product [Linum tenue]